MEANGCTPGKKNLIVSFVHRRKCVFFIYIFCMDVGGDQRYADMSDNRRYSYLLGRAMSSLEPKGTKHDF